MTHTVLLTDATPDPAILGGKAASLVRLTQLGFRVPEAFVIPSAAFKAQVDRLEASDRESIRAALLSLPLDPRLVAEIAERLAVFGDTPLAVRSSATAEDSAEHSFAGQHESVLDVRGFEACMDAVRICWASAWSERAVAYRSRAGLPDSAASMAVVVQRLVEPTWAGVLFTRDPRPDCSDSLVCEAVRGLGESLVSGQATPARWVLRRSDLRVTGAEGTEGGTWPSDDAIIALASVGLRIEEALGAPQDIEWAITDEDAFILQSRPITTLGGGAAEDRIVWSNTNVGELLPELVTPMSFSVVERFVGDLLGALTDRLGLDLSRLPLLGVVGGRVYANMNAVAALIRRMPGMRGRSYADFFGGDQAALREAMKGLHDEDLPQADVHPWKIALRMPGFLYWVVSRAFRGLPRWIEGFGEEGRALAPTDLESLPDDDLPRRIDRLLDFMRDPERSDGMAYAFVATGSAQLLARLCRSWFDDEDGSIANRLLTGLGNVASAEAGLELWRLAGHARALGVADTLCAARDFAALDDELSTTESGRTFLGRWRAFLEEHGHHARGELDVAIPRWHEQPDHLLAMVKGYLAASDPPAEPQAPGVGRRGAEERVALERECRQRLGTLRRRIFDAILIRAQKGIGLREGAKSEFVRRTSFVRRILLEIGRRLTHREILDSRDDVFYLELPELPAALAGDLPHLKSTVARRRAHLERFRAFQPPPVLVGNFDPRRHLPPPLPTGRVLHGLSVSPGLVEGPARVILSSDTDERVLPGEILVAPFTDPGWSPYFLTAAAIVMDMGGILSHGAVVAREYGIPAVVNVGPATRCIKTGQRIVVDAWRGEVRILD